MELRKILNVLCRRAELFSSYNLSYDFLTKKMGEDFTRKSMVKFYTMIIKGTYGLILNLDSISFTKDTTAFFLSLTHTRYSMLKHKSLQSFLISWATLSSKLGKYTK